LSIKDIYPLKMTLDNFSPTRDYIYKTILAWRCSEIGTFDI